MEIQREVLKREKGLRAEAIVEIKRERIKRILREYGVFSNRREWQKKALIDELTEELIEALTTL